MLKDNLSKIADRIRHGLVVSCQAPEGSPLASPEIIAAFARTAEANGACGVRIDSPVNIRAVKSAVAIPVIGIHKIIDPGSEVYITPTVESALTVAASGADIIAFDATFRGRPGSVPLDDYYKAVRAAADVPLMADVATLEEGINACEGLGCDFVGTTLSGYTAGTAHLLAAPDFALVEGLAKRISAPIICEGRIKSPDDVRRAFDCGAHAVVVGKAITGIDLLVQDFVAAARVSAAD
jgi:N-acylglucosamine-6-phosphate 2-epimerase